MARSECAHAGNPNRWACLGLVGRSVQCWSSLCTPGSTDASSHGGRSHYLHSPCSSDGPARACRLRTHHTACSIADAFHAHRSCLVAQIPRPYHRRPPQLPAQSLPAVPRQQLARSRKGCSQAGCSQAGCSQAGCSQAGCRKARCQCLLTRTMQPRCRLPVAKGPHQHATCLALAPKHAISRQ